MAQRLEGRRNAPRCVLDENACLSLSSILDSFSAPINEEQAWAVCYECAKCLQRQWHNDRTRCFAINHLRQILIHKDGFVHPITANPHLTSPLQAPALSEHKLSISLGLAIFDALDYGLAEEEERHLSPSLEQLIDLMTSADTNIDDDTRNNDCEDDVNRHEADEGIERDSGEDEDRDIQKPEVTLTKVLEMCVHHLSSPGHADSHYKAVCRALVAEALELSTFLQKISQGTQDLTELHRHTSGEPDSDLNNLQIADWARLWVQVIRELRQGVKLKKVVVENGPPPIEYELTPYEILMDDIRGRRYKLNKVMVNGDIPPRVKKDAHAVILEFIRSRPPLHPVANRKLKPLEPKLSTPYDELMHSIRQEHSLKPTPIKTVETSRTKLDESDVTPQPTRRLIKADMTLLNFDEEDEDFPMSPADKGHGYSFEGKKEKLQENLCAPAARHLSAVLDLATQSTACTLERRHSITVCESPMKSVVEVLDLQDSNKKSQPASLPAQGSQESLKPVTLFQTEHWKHSMDCLSLTLEEVVHIRNVLTKAELESLLVNAALYEDVSKGKVCFTCKKTKFSFFGQWGQKCRLCKRSICDKCSTKMHIPTEHFASVPVFTLSPGSSSSGDEESPRSIWRLPDVSGFLSQRMSVGSAPSSPNLPSKHSRGPSTPSSVTNTPVGTPILGSTYRRRPLLRSRTLNRADSIRREQLRGELMTVCKECRGMVRHAIVANRQTININQKKNRAVDIGVNSPGLPSGSRASRSRELHLNLSPVY